MAEIKCYPLAIPTDEFFSFWMLKKNTHASTVFQRIDMLAVHPEGEAQILLFRTPDDRKDAYNMIHEVYPDTLCAYVPQICYVDEKYLKGRRA